jgi:hypothetical protein
MQNGAVRREIVYPLSQTQGSNWAGMKDRYLNSLTFHGLSPKNGIGPSSHEHMLVNCGPARRPKSSHSRRGLAAEAGLRLKN